MKSFILKNNLNIPAHSMHPLVFVAGGEGPYANTHKALATMDFSPLRGKRVLLKPNAGRVALPGSGITTNPQVIAAAIDILKEAGAEVAIGESPIVGVDVMEAFETTGITAVASARECALIDMNIHPFVEIAIPDGVAMHSLKVCPDILDYDFIISIPVMKMHMHTGVTLSVKNMKGCLWRRSKVELHMLPPVEGSEEKSIDIAIADMASVLRPHLSIIDGTVGMEGLGPSAGQAKFLDVVVVGSDAFAADAIACELMGTSAQGIPHLRMGAERGYGVIRLDHIYVSPNDWRTWISPFSPPPKNLTIEFPNITILDKNSCSACQSTLLLFLKYYADRLFEYFAPQTNLCIAIGKGHKDVPPGALCIGNCTATHKDKGIFVPGCPPVSSQILTILSGKLAVDSIDGHIRKSEENIPR